MTGLSQLLKNGQDLGRQRERERERYLTWKTFHGTRCEPEIAMKFRAISNNWWEDSARQVVNKHLESLL